MTKIHHNTLKRAAQAGVQLDIDVDGDTVIARANGRDLARSHDPKDALNVAIRELLGDVAKVRKTRAKTATKRSKAKSKTKSRRKASANGEDSDEDDDEEVEEEGGSVVKAKYRKKYRPFKYCNGDDLAEQLREYLKVEDEETGEDRLDTTKLREFAQANGCWVPAYGKLNVGMRRLNVGNRLRAKVRKGHDIVWI